MQAKIEKQRIREENERIKQKERELREAEEERKRIEALERPRILAAKREKFIAERNTRREVQVINVSSSLWIFVYCSPAKSGNATIAKCSLHECIYSYRQQAAKRFYQRKLRRSPAKIL